MKCKRRTEHRHKHLYIHKRASNIHTPSCSASYIVILFIYHCLLHYVSDYRHHHYVTVSSPLSLSLSSSLCGCCCHFQGVFLPHLSIFCLPQYTCCFVAQHGRNRRVQWTYTTTLLLTERRKGEHCIPLPSSLHYTRPG